SAHKPAKPTVPKSPAPPKRSRMRKADVVGAPQHPLVQDTVGPQCSIRIEVFAINRVPAPGSGLARSAFHYSVDVLRITRSGSDQFMPDCGATTPHLDHRARSMTATRLA